MRVATIVTNGDARRDGGAGEALNHKAAEKMTRRLTTTRHQSAVPGQIPALGIGTRSLCGYGLACGGGVKPARAAGGLFARPLHIVPIRHD
jgi:hypothetical protein